MIVDAFSAQAISLAVNLLKAGELVAIPTETVYGLAADASCEAAVAAIYAKKQRPDHNPLIVHIAAVDQLTQWACDIPDIAYRLAEAFWPGPMTLILPKASWVSSRVTANQASIGVRIPAHPATLALLKAFGGGLAAPSANLFTQLSPTTAQHVEQALGSELLVLDGGPAQVGIESTIIDCRTERLTILRPGMLSAEAISDVVGQTVAYHPSAEVQRPGQHWLHYSPQTPLQLVPTLQLVAEYQEADGLVVYSEGIAKGAGSRVQRLAAQPKAYARDLYAALHALDRMACRRILVELPPLDPAWYAVHERLQKAAGGRYTARA